MKTQPPAPDTRPQPAKPRLENLGQRLPSGWWCVSQENSDPPPRDDRKGRTLIISDIHIGTNAKTSWCQKSVHEGYLASLFDDVVAHAAGVDDPVTRPIILGEPTHLSLNEVRRRSASSRRRVRSGCAPA
jgi:hypothetical protein